MAADKKKHKPEDYEKLREVWYKKLKKSGFVDIEVGFSRFTTQSQSFQTHREKAIRDWESKSEYYSLARQFLNNYKFKSNLEKTIWEYHSEGISARDIANLLVKVKIIKPNKDNISAIIRRLVAEMKKLYLVGDK